VILSLFASGSEVPRRLNLKDGYDAAWLCAIAISEAEPRWSQSPVLKPVLNGKEYERRMAQFLTAKGSILRGAIGFVGSIMFLAAQNPTMQGHPEDYSRADIEYGARLYAEQCDRCHGANGTGVSGVDFRSGKFRNAATDPQITKGFPTAGMPPFTLDAADLTGLVAYLRNMNTLDRGSMKVGHADRGQMVFEGKGTCLNCHRVNNKGSRKAPDLSEIGSIRSAGSIERELLDPNNQMMPINRPVHLVARDGKVIDGRRLNEDTYTVQIADEEGRLISLVKSDLREFTVSTKSNMPSFKGELTPEELSDLVSYLLTLKGQ
jgi:putative heme-binding domain-containing protein